jgi:hypothetical protein
VTGPGSTGGLLVETPRFRILRFYNAPSAFAFASTFHGYVGFDPKGLPIVISGWELDRLRREDFGDEVRDLAMIEARTVEILAEAQFKAALARERLAADIRDIELLNNRAAVLNPRIIAILQQVAHASDLPAEEDIWQTWWYDQLGYRYIPPPRKTYTQNAVPQLPPLTIYTCFAASTPVRTLDGPRPIDDLEVGDRVLSQDVATGALSFQPILGVHYNQADATLRIDLGGDTLVASTFHRFWKAGRGWVMARDLKPGNTLRTLGGVVRVASVERGPEVPLFNLDVAESQTFFVGQSAALVHDNALPRTHLHSFDAVPPLAAITGGAVVEPAGHGR